MYIINSCNHVSTRRSTFSPNIRINAFPHIRGILSSFILANIRYSVFYPSTRIRNIRAFIHISVKSFFNPSRYPNIWGSSILKVHMYEQSVCRYKKRGETPRISQLLQRCRAYGFYVVFPFVCCLLVKWASTRYKIAWYGLESCCYMLGWLADSRQPLVFMVCARNQRWKAGIPQIRVGSMHGIRISKTTMLSRLCLGGLLSSSSHDNLQWSENCRRILKNFQQP